jgi:hypothetical protein
MSNFPQLGQPIKGELAEPLFKRLLAIKERSIEKIRLALKDDPEALRYYCGQRPETKEPVLEDLAYLFDKAP